MPVRTMPSPTTTAGRYAPPRSTARAWAVTAAVVVLATINWADKALIGLAAQPLKEEFGFTSAQIGFAGSAFFFLFSVTGAAVGLLGDRIQVRWILFTLAALWGFIQFPILISGTLTVLLLTRVALGAAEGPATAMANTAVFQWFPPSKRAFPSALVTSGASFAKIAAAPALAVVIAAWGWRAGFVTMGVVSFVWCVCWLAIGKEGPYARRAGTAGCDVDTDQAAGPTRLPLRRILLTKSFIGALIGTLPVYGVVAASITWLPSYFENGLGYSRLESGVMFGLPSIASVALMFSVTLVADRRTARGATARATRVWSTAAFLLIGGTSLAVLPAIGAPIAVVAALVVGYGCVCVAMPMANVIVSQIVPAQQLSGALGVFLALQNLAGLIAPVLVGILADRADTARAGFSFAYQIFGVLIVLSAAVVVTLVHPERDAARLSAALQAQGAAAQPQPAAD